MTRTHRGRGEDGFFLPLWALLAVAIFTMVAIVLDLGALRGDRRTNRAAADAAASAGAGDLLNGADKACGTAWSYALLNLQLDPTAPSPCPIPPVAACDPAVGRTWTGSVGGYTIAISNPVTNAALVAGGADAVGGDIAQPLNATGDGAGCERVGVQIGYTRAAIFGRVVGNDAFTTTSNSVAAFRKSTGIGGEKPALVALHPTSKCVIDAGNGLIEAVAVGNQPGLIYADSDLMGSSSGCTSGDNQVFVGGNPGRILARPNASGASGELGYNPLLTEAAAFDSQPTYLGSKLKLTAPITRKPVDNVYHCTNITPTPAGCTAATDPILDVHTRYGRATSAPAGFTVYPDPAQPAQTCNDGALPTLFLVGNWYVTCPEFNVKGQDVVFQGGDIIFKGNVNFFAGGRLVINGQNMNDSTVVIQGPVGVTTDSTTWRMEWYRTFVLMSNPSAPNPPGPTPCAVCGAIDIDNGVGAWTAPETGLLKNLLLWSETTRESHFGGNTSMAWRGVFFSGNSRMFIEGNGTVDARDVQLWLGRIYLQGFQTKLLMAPDPSRSISTSGAGSFLIR